MSPKGWDGFVGALKGQWVINDITNNLIVVTGDKDLSVVLWGCLHKQAIEWLYRKVLALDNRKPIDLISSDLGKEEVMRVLISNPWW